MANNNFFRIDFLSYLIIFQLINLILFIVNIVFELFPIRYNLFVLLMITLGSLYHAFVELVRLYKNKPLELTKNKGQAKVKSNIKK